MVKWHLLDGELRIYTPWEAVNSQIEGKANSPVMQRQLKGLRSIIRYKVNDAIS